MPDTEFSSVEPFRFVPSDGAPPPLIVCDSTLAFVTYGVERAVLERIGSELSSSVGIQTPDEVIGGTGQAQVRQRRELRSKPRGCPLGLPSVHRVLS